MQLTNITRTISLIGAFVLAVTTARAVSPPPDGGYPGNNTAEGTNALFSLTTGKDNTAVGLNALYNNTGAIGNTAVGYRSLTNNATGSGNTACGGDTLVANSSGSSNTALGRSSLAFNLSGSENIAIGHNAGSQITATSYNIDIANSGDVHDVAVIRIGTEGTQAKTFIAGIYAAVATNGIPVYISSEGQLGTTASSARFKQKIHDMADASDVLLSLRPVTFRYKPEIDPDSIPQFGLVAEEVEKLDPDLVVRDGDGKPYTVRYEAVNAMLLNEFLKEHRKAEQQDRQLHEQGATIARQQKEINALKAGLQKVNEKVELNNAQPRLVGTDQ